MADQGGKSSTTRGTLEVGGKSYTIYRLGKLAEDRHLDLKRLPFSIRILLENLLRNQDGRLVTTEHVLAAASWAPETPPVGEIPFMPARVLLQDFTGVPALVDLAAMRDAIIRLGGDPARINPLIPADLIIDHSVQVDHFGSASALEYNAEREFERNWERYVFLRWGQGSFKNLRVVPPATGICHQVNLEYLAQVVFVGQNSGPALAFPDTLVGTDSHTTMINGLGVLGWGVGGIEAEAVMLGQPYYMPIPEVVGVRLTGRLPEGSTATDLVLTLTRLLRRKGVVNKFVEYFGPGLDHLALADRATIANMAPEYGATVGFFPVDDETLTYLRLTGRSADQVALVEAYCKEQSLFRTAGDPEPEFSDLLELDLGTVVPGMAGPKRPQDLVALLEMKRNLFSLLRAEYHCDLQLPEPAPDAQSRWHEEGGAPEPADSRPKLVCEDFYRNYRVPVKTPEAEYTLTHGSVVIAAITSCTNTSNPVVMLGAGLLARNAVERGLTVKPWVKTSLAPGSRVVTAYLEAAGLIPYLEELNFHLVGYGCTTCIGNSGPLPEEMTRAVKDNQLVVAAVLSGNRNFEGRIHPLTRANYLASPPLVVAYALAGTVDIDLDREPLGFDPNGMAVYLKDIWPAPSEIEQIMARVPNSGMFAKEYAVVFQGEQNWKALPAPEGEIYSWEPSSTYVKEPPFFTGLTPQGAPPRDIIDARVLALLGDSVTTDHISPAGTIAADGPAGKYLVSLGVPVGEFNSYGSRRGNHEVMMRGTFANIRLRNMLLPGTEGGLTLHLPGETMLPIYDAAMRYQDEGVPLLVIAGKEYGTGSSRDWAAKGTLLLGVKAVIAESFERIHRGNLVGMGVLPLQFKPGENRESLGISGREVFTIRGIATGLSPRGELVVSARREDASVLEFKVTIRLESPVELDYYHQGGILPTVLRAMAGVD